ncbi:YheC/YheD family endospore coat-associated protein [Bacillus fonticola]|uniref:YheC/YheD family endospore coat-associated protein n=1 Tax=Bacillus fonticola TaxID=2728853 RepID=UPI0014762764|nr:YheC/YheD family protein [Bacillus fonticola]
MTMQRYRVLISDATAVTMVPHDLFRQNNVELVFGHHKVSSFVKEHHAKHVVIPKEIAETLHLPQEDITIHVYASRGCLYIGPLVGIYTAGFSPVRIRPIGERTPFFARLLQTKKTVGMIPFVFGSEHIQWTDQTINGWVWEEGEWRQRIFPFPTVVYDRLPNRRSERRRKNRITKDRLQTDYGVAWYNHNFFNKWHVTELLAKDAATQRFVPDTVRLRDATTLETMLKKHKTVYVKPIHGSLGKGIFQCFYRAKSGHYDVRYQEDGGEKRLRRFSSVQGVYDLIKEERKSVAMLVQQGISLIQYEDRPLDFRVHVNKDQFGEWVISCVAIKVAGKGSATTHVKSGGEVKTIRECVPRDEQDGLLHTIQEASLTIGSVLDHHWEGLIGEVGLDIGMDTNGRVWIFEANSRPGRSIFKHPALAEDEIRTRELPFLYACYVSEQQWIATSIGSSQ